MVGILPEQVGSRSTTILPQLEEITRPKYESGTGDCSSSELASADLVTEQNFLTNEHLLARCPVIVASWSFRPAFGYTLA